MMLALRARSLPLSGPICCLSRPYAKWLKQIFGQKHKNDPKETTEGDAGREWAQISPLEHLKQLAHTHSPDVSTDWISAPLLGQDINFKTKVLLTCEKQFNVSFSDRQLGSIRTLQDVLRLINRPRKPVLQTVFPKIECMESLPANLSVYAASTKPSAKKQARKPFQNYDSPEHAKFLNKQQKEARKRKRRHLTAIVKYYA